MLGGSVVFVLFSFGLWGAVDRHAKVGGGRCSVWRRAGWSPSVGMVLPHRSGGTSMVRWNTARLILLSAITRGCLLVGGVRHRVAVLRNTFSLID